MSPGNRAASQRYHIQHQGVALQRLLVTYLVLLHSPDTCSSCSSMLVNKRNFSLCSSSSWSCSDAMQMRVLAAAPRSLQDLSLNKTLPSHSLFSFILPLPAFSRVSALAACHRATPWTPVMRKLRAPSASLACIHRCRNATSSALHESMRLFAKPSFCVICTANLATRQPLHVSIGVSSPRVCPHPAQVSHPLRTRHERCSLRCASAASSWPASR